MATETIPEHGHEDLTKPPASQWRVSIIWVILLAIPVFVLGGVATMGAALVLINWMVPASDAAMLKNVMFGGGAFGGIATLKGIWDWTGRSRELTRAHISNQLGGLLPDCFSEPLDLNSSLAGDTRGASDVGNSQWEELTDELDEPNRRILEVLDAND